MDKYLQPLGYVFAAIITGGMAFIVAVLSKELKTSEFRQAWIDALRTDISEMVASAQVLHYAVLAMKSYGKEPSEVVKFTHERHDDFVSIRTRSSRILLRLNPKEHKNLIAFTSKLAMLSPFETNEQEVAKCYGLQT
jgi:hypothetical protein